MELDAIKTSYARWSHFYDHTFGAVTNRGRRRAAQFINNRGGKVLELGVGTGLALQFYAKHLDVTGIDFSEEMLRKARRRVAEMGLTQVKSLRQMDARCLDFPDDSFDVVTAMHVLSVVPEPEKVMSEIARVCKPGGRVVITNHFQSDKGVLAAIERFAAPLSDVLGWHSDFRIETVLGEDNLNLEGQWRFPPLKMMTFMVLQKSWSEAGVARVAAG